MRNTIAVLAVAFYGFSWIMASLPGLWALGGMPMAAILSIAVLVTGIVLIVFRRAIGAWIVRGAESDTGVLALAAIRAIGLLLLLSTTQTIVTLVQQYAIPTIRDSALPPATWLPGAGAVLLAQLAAAIVLLSRPVAIARGLDSAAEESPQAVQIQTVLFGAIALWVLVTDLPDFLSSLVQIGKDVQTGDTEMVGGSILWAYHFPEAMASFVRIAIALWIFFGRERFARAWHRLHPMAAGQ